MHLSNFDDYQSYKLVAFYCGCTCVYFSTLLSALYFTNYLYSIGKYSFYPVIGVIIVAEYIKFLVGTFHFPKTQTGRYDGFTSTKRNNLWTRIREILKSSFIIVLMWFVYFFIAILFGAEVFSKHEETFMLSAVLCALTVFPVCLNLGSNSVISLLFGIKMTGDILRESLFCSYRYTLLGTWLGAFVIPLDWDRPWQVWPIPCASGAMLGFIVGNMVMLLSLLPKIIKSCYCKSGKKN
ncbi:hypothetical protein R5R35_010734 [Gryllus longicercus]|uniref:Phosphatidylinositol-glycan biosynthesis class F protein n=1 Tax=Gryllus longicercus TaxID=2509291 RepID=A0AAN9YZN6_9ORTH